jgi:hypothetical protein
MSAQGSFCSTGSCATYRKYIMLVSDIYLTLFRLAHQPEKEEGRLNGGPLV